MQDASTRLIPCLVRIFSIMLDITVISLLKLII